MNRQPRIVVITGSSSGFGAACVEAFAVDGVLSDHGHIDVLVNNAGIHLQGAVEDMDEAAFRLTLGTNFFGAVALTRAVLPSTRRRRGGHVISVSSIGARVGDRRR